ncbi:hypothetical protein KQ247_07165 [Ruegeria pomeroyi]|uniref:PA14 domain-containing protein n=2 Tax=Ruegeria pomeroyi TaxID=89184 RepID=Q5LMF2_RUEPO|nr:PA14 domain-containing protein [Ruegeria pomeroyi]HCE72710.1 hypothetical protein [Ruegeria sp.]AAV96835.1 hypothetical protein SPO3611 [Ruegeria pomeroyi DSS-3]NVK96380.1 hypothetical protein [Ruegeria pomeroyi]NVL01726.1 hypothetical protein [Ruegeria pomeroyi]QWV10364.1 hypothetical protein KQ247_07165 [Ruegeria pomeroyi]
MKAIWIGALAGLAMICAGALAAGPAKLQPANPQPGGLKRGLSVSYGYAKEGEHIRQLAEARSVLKAGAQRGKALRGLDYRDTAKGENTLTSARAENVAAAIRGYIRFDAPGIYEIDFFTNDGVDARIGGQRVGHFDGRQTCDSTIVSEVEVPQAGWYKVDITYFNRLNTSCLMMRWGQKGKGMKWVPNEVFGY